MEKINEAVLVKNNLTTDGGRETGSFSFQKARVL